MYYRKRKYYKNDVMIFFLTTLLTIMLYHVYKLLFLYYILSDYSISKKTLFQVYIQLVFWKK